MIDGLRYSFPGDFAKVDADGSIILLGRGSQVINSGGEKIYPEEVEEAVKRVEGIQDCLVIGVDDEKFGQAVTAVASRVDGSDVDAADRDRRGQARARRLQGAEVDRLRRPSCPGRPNGKADYRAAKVLAADASERRRDSCAFAPVTRVRASVEELLAEELDHALDAGVVALLGQHR